MQKSSLERPLVEDELDVEGRGKTGFDLLDLGITEALGAKLGMVHGRGVGQRAVTHGIANDLFDLFADRSRGCGELPELPG